MIAQTCTRWNQQVDHQLIPGEISNNEIVSPFCSASSRTSTEHHIHLSFTRFSLSDLFSAVKGGWVPGLCYYVAYMKIPANNQVIFIKNVVAMAAYRSCRLWRRVKMSLIHYLLCDHHWTLCRHAISDTGHVT